MHFEKLKDATTRKANMLRIDGFYLYEIGFSLHPISSVQVGNKVENIIFSLFTAQNVLEAFLFRSVYSQPLKTSRAAGIALLEVIKEFTENQDLDMTKELDFLEVYKLTSKINEFETILKAELGLMAIYLVVKKRGYDISDLIDNGWVLFPEDLPSKVSEAIPDIKAGTRCIAFELNTAAGFHLHRANESILHRYFDAVSHGAPRPQGRTIGAYLSEMDQLNIGDPKVKSCLRDLKDLHRNPLIHPEDSIDTVDDAIALLGSIHSAVVHMLKAIPAPVPALDAAVVTQNPSPNLPQNSN